MKASEVIQRLQNIVGIYGDQPITLICEVNDTQLEDTVADIAYSKRTGIKLIGSTSDEEVLGG